MKPRFPTGSQEEENTLLVEQTHNERLVITIVRNGRGLTKGPEGPSTLRRNVEQKNTAMRNIKPLIYGTEDMTFSHPV